MSFRALLKHRCNVLRLTQTSVDGSPQHVWNGLTDDAGNPLVLRCFLDLDYLRKGKDEYWVAEAGRPQDRTGVWFGLPDAPIKSGDRIAMIKGPTGTFEIQGAIDEAWQPAQRHHLEIGVIEVAASRARAAELRGS